MGSPVRHAMASEFSGPVAEYKNFFPPTLNLLLKLEPSRLSL